MSAVGKAFYCASFGASFSTRLAAGMFKKNGRPMPRHLGPAAPRISCEMDVSHRPLKTSRRPSVARLSRLTGGTLAIGGGLLGVGALTGNVALLISFGIAGGVAVTTVVIVRKSWRRARDKWSVA